MFTVVDIGYFDRRSGSNWIVFSLLGRSNLCPITRKCDRASAVAGLESGIGDRNRFFG
ncbi:hypothetical protein QUA81_12745 [Microcoleus sp. F6_B4]